MDKNTVEHQITSELTIGVMGGSGIYEINGISNIEEISISTPFGNPSAPFMVGYMDGVRVVFLPRHGQGHRLLPSELNYRANIFGFKVLGATHVLAVTAVGSLQEHISPLDMVIPDQLIDRTSKRPDTFFGNGIAAHIPFAEPFCPDLSHLLFKKASTHAKKVHKGGTLVSIEGPAFSTRAESILYRKWGIDIIGMTTMQEARLAREAEICYAALAMVTDYDSWKEDSEAVSVDAVVSNLAKNSSCAEAIIQSLVPDISKNRNCFCVDSLKGAVMTKADCMDGDIRQRLEPLIGKYFPRGRKKTSQESQR